MHTSDATLHSYFNFCLHVSIAMSPVVLHASVTATVCALSIFSCSISFHLIAMTILFYLFTITIIAMTIAATIAMIIMLGITFAFLTMYSPLFDRLIFFRFVPYFSIIDSTNSLSNVVIIIFCMKLQRCKSKSLCVKLLSKSSVQSVCQLLVDLQNGLSIE